MSEKIEHTMIFPMQWIIWYTGIITYQSGSVRMRDATTITGLRGLTWEFRLTWRREKLGSEGRPAKVGSQGIRERVTTSTWSRKAGVCRSLRSNSPTKVDWEMRAPAKIPGNSVGPLPWLLQLPSIMACASPLPIKSPQVSLIRN